MVKNVEFGKSAQKRLFNGLEKSAKLITSTMGIGGQNVMFKNELDEERSTKDGVTVALNIHHLEDPIEELGNLALREASVKTAENAGDGTTTSTLLAYSLVKEGLLALENDDTLSSNEMLKGIEKSTQMVIDYLETQKLELDKLNSSDLLTKISTLSANGDEKIGSIIANAVLTSGKDGLVTLKKGAMKSSNHRLEEVGGVVYGSGFNAGGVFVTNQAKATSELKNPYIFITENPIETEQAVVEFQQRILNGVVSNGRDLLVICPKLSDMALSMLAQYHNAPNFTSNFCATGIPYSGTIGSMYLDDLAVLVGAKAITARSGEDIGTCDLSYCGSALSVVVKSRETIIIDPKGDSTDEGVDRINDRIMFLDVEIENAPSQYAKKHLIERKSSLMGVTTLVHIDALTHQELNEKFDRADDSLKACTCAMKEGVLSGGGTALLRATKHINFKDMDKFTTEGQLKGASIVQKAIKEPFVKILSNVGIPQETIFGLMYKLKENDSQWEVYDPMSNKCVDAIESGIIDPIMVTKVALRNAVSVAGTILRTGGVIYTQVADNIDESRLLEQY